MADRVLIFDGTTVVGENSTDFFRGATLLEIETLAFSSPDYLELTAFMEIFTSPFTNRLIPIRSAEDNREVINVLSSLYAVPLPRVSSDYNCRIVLEMDIATPIKVWVTANDCNCNKAILDRIDERYNQLNGSINALDVKLDTITAKLELIQLLVQIPTP